MEFFADAQVLQLWLLVQFGFILDLGKTAAEKKISPQGPFNTNSRAFNLIILTLS